MSNFNEIVEARDQNKINNELFVYWDRRFKTIFARFSNYLNQKFKYRKMFEKLVKEKEHF